MIDQLLRKALEARLATAGIDWLRLHHLELRPIEGRLSATLKLEGEPEPVQAEARYHVEGETVIIDSLETSRRWMTEALSVALLRHGGRFPLPTGWVGQVARRFL